MTYKHVKSIDSTKTLILPCKKNDLEAVSDFIPSGIQPDFEGEFDTYCLLYGAQGQRIYLLGLGEEKHQSRTEEPFRKLCFETQKYWNEVVQVYAEELTEEVVKKAVIGFEMAQYKIGAFKTEKDDANKRKSIEFICANSINSILSEGQHIGETINNIKALVDAPPNIKTPEYLGEWAKASAKNANYKCTVLDQEQLEELGFQAVLSVGRGSINKPVAIICEHKPKASKGFDLALVGKGITFDSGGLSIKPSTNLHYMKSDMGGAAVVLGIIELVAKLQLNVNVVGIVCSAENAVDASSYRPGDVIQSYAGKSIEIIDTDAEGRLALADGLSYAVKNIKPNYLIDLATLTGSVVRTLGNAAAGMFTHSDAMADVMSKCGTKVHERVWRLPLYDDFESDLHSDVADIRNFSGKPVAGAINAAKFLEAFTEKHENWLHLDIAGVAFGDSSYAKMKSASGYGIQLITEFIKEIASK